MSTQFAHYDNENEFFGEQGGEGWGVVVVGGETLFVFNDSIEGPRAPAVKRREGVSKRREESKRGLIRVGLA